jgi:AcrR family transcriptional regulator
MATKHRATANGRRSVSEEIGRDGLVAAHELLRREQVSDIQRARMLGAMVDAAAERGLPNVTVANIVSGSGVSRRTFYEIFDGCEDCFLAAFDRAVEQITAQVVVAYERPGNWGDRVRAGLTALLELLDFDRPTGQLVIVEALAAGHRALERRRDVLAQVIAVLDEGRREAKRETPLPPLTAEGIVGAVLSVIHTRMVESEPEPLVTLVNPLMSMIVLPYLGPAAARRELARPAPASDPKAKRLRGDPLQGLDMRLTYRTVRVLMAVAQAPGASNRKLADAAGVADQGQISKLLTRLTTLGLIENGPRGAVRGEPNAWRLTPKGHEVQSALGVGALGGEALPGAG